MALEAYLLAGREYFQSSQVLERPVGAGLCGAECLPGLLHEALFQGQEAHLGSWGMFVDDGASFVNK
jgi:hypothetical protein